MSADPSIWYRVGYALERARARDVASDEGAPAREPRERSRARRGDARTWPSADDLITSGAIALAGRILDAWRPAGKVSFTRLLKAGAAGAGAALLLDLVRPLLHGRAGMSALDRDTGARMLAGAGQGLLYGAVVEPRVPGPPLVKGAVFALAEYLADPAGGLSRLLGSHAPHRGLPVVADLLEDLGPQEREYLDHLVFAVALAVLCGEAPTRNGVVEIED